MWTTVLGKGKQLELHSRAFVSHLIPTPKVVGALLGQVTVADCPSFLWLPKLRPHRAQSLGQIPSQPERWD